MSRQESVTIRADMAKVVTRCELLLVFAGTALGFASVSAEGTPPGQQRCQVQEALSTVRIRHERRSAWRLQPRGSRHLVGVAGYLHAVHDRHARIILWDVQQRLSEKQLVRIS